VQQLTANATTDRVTVTNVLTGAIVNVYHPISGVLIGTATNNEATIATVVVTIASGLSDGQEVEVTFIELRKIESNETAVEAVYDVSEAPIVQQLAANATKDTVTVTNVPAGTIVNIYSVEGDLIGRATNNES